MGFVKYIQFADILDILLIALLIYFALIWFRQTSARFVIIGISILGVVYMAAKYLGLYLSTAIFQAFFAVFFIAVVIIFQEELRHFFEKIALWGTWRGRRKLGPKHVTVETIVRTVANLSQKRVGALIVMRGEDPLDRHLEGGVDLQGEPSEPLLESLFDPHSAGHDGAVVIDNNIIERFGTHLPLSKDLRQIAQYGTRHTAALGLAERCDALCIVVSEERGSIAIARDGKIHPLVSLTQLNNILDKFYEDHFPLHKKKVGAGWFSSNLKEKAFAILLSGAIWWVFGQQTETIVRDFMIPIEYRNIPPMLVLEEPKKNELSVTLSGLERAFDLLEPRTLRVSLDLSHIQPGEETFVVTREDVRTPANLKLERIDPSYLKFFVSKLIQLNVPIKVETYGQLPQNLSLESIKVKPQRVKVIASQYIQDDLIKITTEPIDLSLIKEPTTLTQKLVIPTDIRLMDGKESTVKVSINVVKGVNGGNGPAKEKSNGPANNKSSQSPSLSEENMTMTPLKQPLQLRK